MLIDSDRLRQAILTTMPERSEVLLIVDNQPEGIVRCKGCKHRPIKPEDYENGFDLEFPDSVCPCQCDDGWYSWYPADNWLCADGERKEGDGDGT